MAYYGTLTNLIKEQIPTQKGKGKNKKKRTNIQARKNSQKYKCTN
jgi:hypothetical protein